MVSDNVIFDDSVMTVKETMQALEAELDCPVLYSILPDWFEAKMDELRSMIVNKITFPQLELRTIVSNCLVSGNFSTRLIGHCLGRVQVYCSTAQRDHRGMGNTHQTTSE